MCQEFKEKIADIVMKMNQCSHRKREPLDSFTGRKSANSIGMVFVKVKTMCNVLPTWSFKVSWSIPRTYPHPYSFSTQFTQWLTMSLNNVAISKNDWNHENWYPFLLNIYVYFPGNKPIFYLTFNSCFFSVVQLVQTLVHLVNQTLIISDI